MRLSISTQEESGYLTIKAVGEWTLDDLKGLADTIATEAKNRGYNRVLVDVSKISGLPREFDRFLLGEYVASTLRGIKVAAVYRTEDINKFFENTAVNRGAWINVLADKQTALQWLMKGKSKESNAGDGK
jgi:hypothetical protein